MASLRLNGYQETEAICSPEGEEVAIPPVKFRSQVAESARAHSYYSISTGMQTGDPRLYHF